ncbi:Phage SPO1 DNA polymerase-related protein [Tepidanaerobacter acetatoxydans Re1]|uniref:Type-4 uracil-DNA glycosylase n=1 Tax=Tepidanaerobacter acetatoxydans (strain DSM 21804 / JCM 16047 / Re1) TaxID=1209989 RepID=F4LUD4_TEPAE|nr:uracil-DNA glycosylase [Tepidanaerobacter acetatoxydans]AEE91464.1 phage SPO1 DNA polymerase-related protein [Tepidanaerobacter acetatoxydans Re1]CCP26170.1 Phage SPO1 DNA polymerase-related protein [Tepidanaerobacter acetatoxydans Re1]
MLESKIKESFTTVEISLPDIIKLLLDLKDEFNIQNSDVDTIVKAVKLDNEKSKKQRDYLYNRIKEHINTCQSCLLYAQENHTHKVAGEGALNSPLVLIGEGPGFDEDKQGRPFVGRAGQLLTTILNKMDIRREKVYITNVIKCRPPQNRTPLQKEIKACSKNLELELSLIQPKVIIALGAVPLNYFKSGSSIMRERGQWINSRDYWIMPTFHPAYILRQHGKTLNKVKWLVWQDFNEAVAKAKEMCPEYDFSS